MSKSVPTIHYDQIDAEGKVDITESTYEGKKFYFLNPSQHLATSFLDSESEGSFTGAHVFQPGKEYPEHISFDARLGPLTAAQGEAFLAYSQAVADRFEAQQGQFNIPRTAMTVPFLHGAEERNGEYQLRTKVRLPKSGHDKDKNDCEVTFVRFRPKITADDAGIEIVKFTWSDGSQRDRLEYGSTGKEDHEATWNRAMDILSAGGRCCMLLKPNVWASNAGKGLHFKVKKIFVVDANVNGGGYDCMLPPGRVLLPPAAAAAAGAATSPSSASSESKDLQDEDMDEEEDV